MSLGEVAPSGQKQIWEEFNCERSPGNIFGWMSGCLQAEGVLDGQSHLTLCAVP